MTRLRWPRHPFARFLLRRLAALVLLAWGITLVAFVLTQLVPGDPALANLGQVQMSNPEAIAAFREKHGLDEPLPAQYGLYLWHLVQGDLGVSQQTHQPVLHDLSTFVPATVELAIVSILLAFVLGVALGVLAAVRRDSAADHAVRIGSLAGISMPTFWLGLVALYLLFFRWGIFPGGGRLSPGELAPDKITGLFTVDALLTGEFGTLWDALEHLVLPALVLAAFNVSLIARYTRSAVLEVIGEDYVRAARAKGMPERTVIPRHILRAALPSVITVMGLVFANVLTGAVLIENIFSWPGVGQYAFRGATNLDLPAIMGVSLFVAVVYIVVNFAVDVLYGVIDPRIRVT